MFLNATAMLMPIMLLAPPGESVGPTTIELRDTAVIEGDRITLCELAEITPADRADALGMVEVGPAPLPGGSRRLTRGYLKMRLRRSGVEGEGVEFTGAESVEVRRGARPAAGRPTERSDAGEAAGPGADQHGPEVLAMARGAPLRLTVVCGAVTVGAEATLLEEAVVGERARMRVEQTRETVVAQIVRPGEAILRRE